jgi:hypothetical protein
MKHIHVLPTDKPSRLFKSFGKLNIGDYITKRENLQVTNQHIYITSDEEIKEGDWVITPTNDIIQWAKVFRPDGKKIIITTDQDLIAEGIQPIDDTFLEWFVNNPSCEFVDVRYEVLKPFQSVDKGYMIHLPDNEVLGEPKQETLEEAAKKHAGIPLKTIIDTEERYFNSNVRDYDSFIAGAKSDAARDYWFKIFKEKFIVESNVEANRRF